MGLTLKAAAAAFNPFCHLQVRCDWAWGTSFPGTWSLGAGTENLIQACALSAPPTAQGSHLPGTGTRSSAPWAGLLGGSWLTPISAPVTFHRENVSQQSLATATPLTPHPHHHPRALCGFPITPLTLQHLHPTGHLTPITDKTPHMGQPDKLRSGAQLEGVCSGNKQQRARTGGDTCARSLPAMPPLPWESNPAKARPPAPRAGCSTSGCTESSPGGFQFSWQSPSVSYKIKPETFFWGKMQQFPEFNPLRGLGHHAMMQLMGTALQSSKYLICAFKQQKSFLLSKIVPWWLQRSGLKQKHQQHPNMKPTTPGGAAGLLLLVGNL